MMSRFSAAAPRFLVAVNAFAVIFSVIWLAGHSTERVFDWEFWFALGSSWRP